ncbi:MAG: class I SAM-dependent methyltransferase [Sporichthyaceae bacterium]
MTARDDSVLPPLSPNGWLRWEVVNRLLPPATGRQLDVLEVGCGQGGFAARLAQRFDYVGVEPDATSCTVAQQRLAAVGNGEVRHGDLSAVEPDETFDLVVAFEVIEHIEDDAGALAGWAEHLRPGGWLLLSTPAWQKRYGAADEMVGHFRRYDPPVLRDRMAGAGLTDVELVHFGAPLGYLLEAGRNYAGRKKLAAGATATSMAERSDASGRTLQPSTSWTATAARLGTLPFRAVQRAFPGTGPGLVARGRKPAA